MPLALVQPAYLWLLLLLPVIWLPALLAPSRLPRWRRALSLGLRTTILLALVLALAGAALVWPAREVTTIFLIDHSDSVAPVERARADAFLQAALQRKPAAARAGVVVFGREAVVEQPPTTQVRFTRVTVAPPSDQTDVARALKLALALLPAETRKRLVLLSDGAETRGAALELATAARAAGVPIDVVPLISPPSDEDIAFEALEGPTFAREGQAIGLTAVLRSGRARVARLTLLRDRQPVLESEVSLAAGLNRLPLSVPAPPPGFHTWEARVTASDDPVGANNVQFGFVEVRGTPRVLLVAGDAARSQALAAALQAARLTPVTIAPAELPSSLTGLDAYDVIALVDVPYRDLPPAAAVLLPAYVRDLGRGLLMVGGEQSYAAGGYRDTPVEAALPVTMQTQGLRITPDVALVLVLDRSGSMAGHKLELAKEGAAQAFTTLEERDHIGVIAFDTDADWIVPLQRRPDAASFIRAVGGIAEGGGTDLRPGLEQATAALLTADAKVKHIMLLTDGQAERNYDDVIQRMRQAGITLTAVGIDDFDPHLREVAAQTGGRFYAVRDLNDVPRVFFDESLRVARRGIVERSFVPQVVTPVPAVRALEAVPPLHGYNAVTPRNTAQVVLQSDEGDPILAQWQYGLGRAAAWTSDFKGQWARDWVAWDGFGTFVAQLVGDLLPAPDTPAFEAAATLTGNALAVELRDAGVDAQPRSGLRAVARLIAADGVVSDMPLREVEPGRYHGTAPLPAPGVYRVRVIADDASGRRMGTATSGVVVPPSAEYLQRDGNQALLLALAQRTDGRVDPAPERVWDAPAGAARHARPLTWPLLWLAVLLWPLDIAVRRLFVPPPHPRTVATWTRMVRTRARPAVDLEQRRVQVRRRQRAPLPPPAEAPPSSEPAAPAPSTFDWRRNRRSMVERPDRSRQ
ncbi:VWA domain-containing protein [Kallotenue papyrolyticum]|uniref:VWA domain-containing protein n=1 Tax=Kallotenue papyrolyticum TaxID=1325125 RepID=UPI0004922F83|nr:VWA domain-containing protein [Kallotenue papyrolyticum]